MSRSPRWPNGRGEPPVYNWSMNLTGVFAPVPTPFDHQDRVDRAGLTEHRLDRSIDDIGVVERVYVG